MITETTLFVFDCWSTAVVGVRLLMLSYCCWLNESFLLLLMCRWWWRHNNVLLRLLKESSLAWPSNWRKVIVPSGKTRSLADLHRRRTITKNGLLRWRSSCRAVPSSVIQTAGNSAASSSRQLRQYVVTSSSILRILEIVIKIKFSPNERLSLSLSISSISRRKVSSLS